MGRPAVVLTRRWTRRAEEELARRYELRAHHEERELGRDEIVARCEGAVALCPTASDPIPAELIAALPESVRLIASFGVGVNHIDLEAAAAKGLAVSNTPGAVTEDTADLAFGLVLAVARNLARGDALVRSGRWRGVSVDDPLLGTRLWGKALGVVGLGRIGAAVARRARGFGMSVLYHNRSPSPEAERELDARYCRTLVELLEGADVVTLHCPLTDETHHLIDAAALGRMKAGALLINASRGPIVDEAALAEALASGVIAGAGLDVYEFEPRVTEALKGLPNVVLSPHLGTATRETRDAMGLRVIENIDTFLADGRPVDQVLP